MATRAVLLLEIRNIAPQPLMRRARGIYRVAAHHDVDVAALLKVRIEDHFAGRAPARLRTLENSAVLHKVIRVRVILSH